MIMFIQSLEDYLSYFNEIETTPHIIDDGFNGIPFGDIDHLSYILNFILLFIIISYIFYKNYNKKIINNISNVNE